MATSATPTLSVQQWRQVGVISAVALTIFAVLRWLPTGTSLSHMDFRVDAKNSIEFCDPLNPQFIPVVAVASPVSLSLESAPARTGEPVEAKVTLRTASGKAIEPQDLLVVHTRKLHLLIVDPSLSDYQHVHPEPTGKPGEWGFRFTPQASGAYRVFADFTPVAMNRGLYANAEINVSGSATGVAGKNLALPDVSAERGEYRFALTPTVAPLRAKQPIDLKFTVAHRTGGAVPLEPVMDAYAHLVAFDQTRSGFAHLHPMQVDPLQPPDRTNPTLNFKITIPSAGRYVIWAQVNVGGHEMFVPFWFDVVG